MAGVLFLEVLFADISLANHMALHIKACSMGEEEAKADYARHNAEVLAHVNPDKVRARVGRNRRIWGA